MKSGKKGEKLLTLDRVNRPRVSDMSQGSGGQGAGSATQSNQMASTGGGSKANPEFPEQIRQAQFYNDDKIITVASGNKLYFYQFELPINDKIRDDVKRL